MAKFIYSKHKLILFYVLWILVLIGFLIAITKLEAKTSTLIMGVVFLLIFYFVLRMKITYEIDLDSNEIIFKIQRYLKPLEEMKISLNSLSYDYVLGTSGRASISEFLFFNENGKRIINVSTSGGWWSSKQLSEIVRVLDSMGVPGTKAESLKKKMLLEDKKNNRGGV